jgi:hypothetical protein
MRNFIRILFVALIAVPLVWIALPSEKAEAWGFYGHKRINRMAVFTLPPEMIGFYKKHIEYITEHAVDPDKRRYSIPEEAPRHYIDIDHYGPSAFDSMPKFWKKAVAKYSEDTLNAYGIVPWWIDVMTYRLADAFRQGDVDRILRLSAELGHYVGDAHVPLHTTENYNGQLTNQHGIHGFWESRVPEVYGAIRLFCGSRVLRGVGDQHILGHCESKSRAGGFRIATRICIDEINSFRQKVCIRTTRQRHNQNIQPGIHKCIQSRIKRNG